MLNVALLALSAAFAAGWAALSLELAWMRAASAALPGLVPAAALVVPAFLLAWSAGSWWGGRFVDQREGSLGAAARWLALSALGAWLLPVFGALLRPSVPPDELALRLLAGGLPALPVAFGLGGALPLLARSRVSEGLSPARATGAVAAALALGGAAGAGSFVPLLSSELAPSLGAALALAGAALVCWLLGLAGATRPAPEAAAEVELEPRGTPLLPLVAFVGGGLLVAGQLALLRVAAQRDGASVLTSVQVLGWLHLGMALGAWLLMPRWRLASAESLCSLALGLAGLALLWPGGLPGRAASLDVAWPCVLLGLGAGSLVTAASRAGRRPASRLGSWVGDLAAASTLGGVVGGWAYLDALDGGSTTPALLRLGGLAALGSAVVLAALACGPAGRRPVALAVGALVSGLLALGWSTPSWSFPWRSADDETGLLARVEGRHGVTTVVALADGGRRLKLDGRFGMGGSGHAALSRRLGRIAAAMAPEAERALVLGLGTGHTLAGVATTSPARVECVERNGALWSLGEFVAPVTGVLPGGLTPRGGPVQVVAADARAWVARHAGEYDLIVGDLFFPWMSGAGDLLSREQFELVRRALAPDGVFVQWLPLHQLPWPAFGAATRAFCEAFPTARAFLATPLADQPLVALVGGLDGGVPSVERLDALFTAAPDGAGPSDARELFDLYLADSWELQGRFADAPLPTLARPVTELMSLGRQDDEAAIALRNTRLLAELVSPLVTTSLSRHPIDPRENRELGRMLTVRANVERQLLLARAALLERATLDVTRSDQRPRRAELDATIDQALVAGWVELPGHAAVRAALLERAGQLVGEQRWEDGAALLHAALERGRDVALAAMLGGIFTQLGFLDEALALLRGARGAGPPDRSLLINLGAALLFQGGADDEAREALRAARELGELPPVHAVALGVLERRESALPSAQALVDALDQGEAWSVALRRLLAERRG